MLSEPSSPLNHTIIESNIATNILTDALNMAGLNDSYVVRQTNLTSPSNNQNIPDFNNSMEERLRYLDISLAQMQNQYHGQDEQIIALKNQVETLDIELNKLLQYNRRENIEISGIPENVQQNELENIVIGALRRIGVWNLESYEIAACHRLKEKWVMKGIKGL